MTIDHLRSLLLNLDADAVVSWRAQKLQAYELALRDAVMFTYLFIGCRRGSDLLYTNWEDLFFRQARGELIRAVDLWQHSGQQDCYCRL
jgi:hypothetical protein